MIYYRMSGKRSRYAAVMLLASALLALFLVGCWLYCLLDAVLTPARECPGLPKPAWVGVIAVTWVAGAFAWLIALRLNRDQALGSGPRPDSGPGRADQDDARGVRPGHRAVASGPEDDPDFIRALAAALRRDPPVS
jgi:hypothetical protein